MPHTELNPDANPKKIWLALERASLANLTRADWEELLIDTGCDEVITIEDLARSVLSEGYPYLTRKRWVRETLETIVRKDSNNMKTIEDYIHLKEWLETNSPRLYAELYEIGNLTIDEIDGAGTVSNKAELDRRVERLKKSIYDGDPEQTVGLSKDLLESVMTTILKESRQENMPSDMPSLWKSVQLLLGVDIDDKGDKKLEKNMKQTLGSLTNIIIGVAEVRNLAGTGHGRAEGSKIDKKHALLLANSVGTLSTYLLSMWEDQKKSSDNGSASTH